MKRVREGDGVRGKGTPREVSSCARSLSLPPPLFARACFSPPNPINSPEEEPGSSPPSPAQQTLEQLLAGQLAELASFVGNRTRFVLSFTRALLLPPFDESSPPPPFPPSSRISPHHPTFLYPPSTLSTSRWFFIFSKFIENELGQRQQATLQQVSFPFSSFLSLLRPPTKMLTFSLVLL